MDPAGTTSIALVDERLEQFAARQAAEAQQSEPGTPTQQPTPSRSAQRVSSKASFQRLVLTDPVAFKYLEEDPCAVTISRKLSIPGYQLYIVEQWVCSRAHPTFVINTYTGDKSHTVVAGVLSVPTDEKKWSERMRVYFNAMDQFHTRKQESSFGTVMVTNLSTFPPMLTTIPVQDGDVGLHLDDFIVNENLKRLGCSGRAGLTVKPPAADTQAKFYQLYQTCDKIEFNTSVKELIRVCQLALVMFDKLAPEYADGLLCNATERAIYEWWTETGSFLYGIEPLDGILGPTTVSAILGTFMGARNRLHAYGAPVSKDPFDIHGFEKGIYSFQKAQGLDRTRRLDGLTLEKLHRVTAKAASGEVGGLQRAVKSTVAELGGKGGEMVMEMVGGGKDKAGISEIETYEIERFIQLITGDHARWLWRGKPAKPLYEARYDIGDERIFTPDRGGGYIWTRRKRDDCASNRPSIEGDQRKQTDSPIGVDDKDQLRNTLKRSVTNKVSDARAGLGRFRDAVGLPTLRPHHHKHSKESVDLDANLSPQLFMGETATSTSSKDGGGPEGSAWMDSVALSETSRLEPSADQTGSSPSTAPELGHVRTYEQLGGKDMSPSDKGPDFREVEGPPGGSEEPERKQNGEYHGLVPVTRIRRRAESVGLPELDRLVAKDNIYPRRLSSSYAEEYLLRWEEIGDIYSEAIDPTVGLVDAILYEDMIFSDNQEIAKRMREVGNNAVDWVDEKVTTAEKIEKAVKARAIETQAAYQRKLMELREMYGISRDVMAEEENVYMQVVKNVEMMSEKLDYDVDTLRSRVEDAEAVLRDYEHVIANLENRTASVLDGQETENISWLQWVHELWNRQRYKFQAHGPQSSNNGKYSRFPGEGAS
ncbi:Sin3 complex subunit Stb2 [Nannizzia gypsea CBS 118893]|uniref:Sin3 complex subunit Stb2 n=1 Tax=Arthroderma gypseum (strain ATCC MYA-4604 / CBS 118893) TaxID=535722 RepID=E4V348_ARTGP|nr:Sin3 complex subunit Stb2 [Nannizzia gypsea CBS 118893]EFR04422.1 Sin3 complex subunit Stb2 [Nannizzia gypsea CBS 118893]